MNHLELLIIHSQSVQLKSSSFLVDSMVHPLCSLLILVVIVLHNIRKWEFLSIDLQQWLPLKQPMNRPGSISFSYFFVVLRDNPSCDYESIVFIIFVEVISLLWLQLVSVDQPWNDALVIFKHVDAFDLPVERMNFVGDTIVVHFSDETLLPLEFIVLDIELVDVVLTPFFRLIAVWFYERLQVHPVAPLRVRI